MSAPRISIAMATCNGGRFIGEQLASFAAQVLRPDELVVTDDCSTDATVALVERFAASAPFAVRIEVNPERLGYSRNFERAIGLAAGEIIFISDQDDAWDADKIAVMADALHQSPGPAVAVNDQRIVDASGTDSGMTMFGNFRRARCPDSDLIAGSCTAFTRDLLPLLLPFPAALPYDSWIGAVADALGIKRLVERPLQVFRRHGANASDPIVAVANPTRWSAFRRHGLSDPRGGWKSEIAWRSALAARLCEEQRMASLGIGQDSVAEARRALQHHIAALERRLALLARPRALRWAAALGEWRGGLYREFGGALSLAKDVVRP